MNADEILKNLEELVVRLGYKLRYEKGDFAGGGCRVGEDKMIIINNSLLDSQKIAIIAAELAKLDLDDTFLMPEIREIIESCKNTEK
ncbi:MAG: hypothetical protein DWQ10_06810 [Calditrichaeota bacterium]|nr:MAG: hypothetical protein DWQ10_06810 [Calditrichota bacterium]